MRKDKLCMEKPVITQKLVLKPTQTYVTATQNFPTQAQFQHQSDFEHKNFVTVFFGTTQKIIMIFLKFPKYCLKECQNFRQACIKGWVLFEAKIFSKINRQI
jgi:hypothetical protein